MPPYYLHIRTADDVLLDEEGIDLPDLNAARDSMLPVNWLWRPPAIYWAMRSRRAKASWRKALW